MPDAEALAGDRAAGDAMPYVNRKLHEDERAVLGLIRTGHGNLGALLEGTGYEYRRLQNVLKRLRNHGVIASNGLGPGAQWAYVPKGGM